MTHLLSASHYSDHASQAKVRIVENVPIAKQTYRLRFDCQKIATRIVLGSL